MSGLVNKLYRAYGAEICQYLKVKFGGGPPEPEDIVQQAFTQFSSLKDPAEIDNPRAFLYRAAINLVIDDRRKEQRRRRLLQKYSAFDEEITDDRQPERVLLGREQLNILESVLMALSERDRTFFLLNRLEGVSIAEIARRTNMSPSGVRFVIEQVLQKCQAALQAAERTGGR